MIDDYVLQSLANWIDAKIHETDREQVITDILSLLAREPEVIEGRTWEQIRMIAQS